jgi:hypothetical protein
MVVTPPFKKSERDNAVAASLRMAEISCGVADLIRSSMVSSIPNRALMILMKLRAMNEFPPISKKLSSFSTSSVSRSSPMIAPTSDAATI